MGHSCLFWYNMPRIFSKRVILFIIVMIVLASYLIPQYAKYYVIQKDSYNANLHLGRVTEMHGNDEAHVHKPRADIAQSEVISSHKAQSDGAGIQKAQSHMKDAQKIHEKTRTQGALINGESVKFEVKPHNYLDEISEVVKNNLIVVMMVDEGYLDMAINFYLTSLQRFKITNYIFVSIDNTACTMLQKFKINCGTYKNMHLGNAASTFGTEEFNQKLWIRTDILNSILQQGYSVLQTDTDIIFMQNPLENIMTHCPVNNCHMASLQDYNKAYNAGFTLFHSHNYTKELLQIAKATNRPHEQGRMNAAIDELQNKTGDFNATFFPTSQYMNGGVFYRMRFFVDTAEPCPLCKVVHISQIRGKSEKVLRAREMQQWMYDDNGYYSSTSNKYLQYSNPPDKAEVQLERLATALVIGNATRRIVILPKFHCGNASLCPLLYLTSITKLDEVFGGKYRESTFLLHPLVPNFIKHAPVRQLSMDPVNAEVTDLNHWFKSLKLSKSALPSIILYLCSVPNRICAGPWFHTGSTARIHKQSIRS